MGDAGNSREARCERKDRHYDKYPSYPPSLTRQQKRSSPTEVDLPRESHQGDLRNQQGITLVSGLGQAH
jgi:hypothetical protein